MKLDKKFAIGEEYPLGAMDIIGRGPYIGVDGTPHESVTDAMNAFYHGRGAYGGYNPETGWGWHA